MQTCMKKVKVAIFFENFTNSKINVRTQISPKIDKNYFYKYMHIYSGSANNNKHEKVKQRIYFVS